MRRSSKPYVDMVLKRREQRTINRPHDDTRCFIVTYRDEDGRWFLEHNAQNNGTACWSTVSSDAWRFHTAGYAKYVADKFEQRMKQSDDFRLRGVVHVKETIR